MEHEKWQATHYTVHDRLKSTAQNIFVATNDDAGGDRFY